MGRQTGLKAQSLDSYATGDVNGGDAEVTLSAAWWGSSLEAQSSPATLRGMSVMKGVG